MPRTTVALLCAALAAGCAQEIRTLDGGPGAPDAGGADAESTTDTGPQDAGVPADSGAPHDSGVAVDAGMEFCERDQATPALVTRPMGEAGFANVRALAFDFARNLYVLSRNATGTTGWVTVLSPGPAHTLIRTFGRDVLGRTVDMTVSGNQEVYILETDPPKVIIYPQAGMPRSWEIDRMKQDDPRGIEVDDNGSVYVGDLNIGVYSNVGVRERVLGVFGAGIGRVGRSNDLAFDAQGFLWVADISRNRIHQFDALSGDLLQEIGGRGMGPGNFDTGAEQNERWGPWRVAVDTAGRLWGNDPFVSRIVQFSRAGSYLSEYDFGGTRDIGPIAVDPGTGYVYVGQASAVRIICPP